MSSVVHKFPLSNRANYICPGSVVVEMPTGAEILSVQLQNGIPVLWALVDPAAVKRGYRVVAVVMTGQGYSFPDDAVFIGTLQFNDGAYVVHLFDLGYSPL